MALPSCTISSAEIGCDLQFKVVIFTNGDDSTDANVTTLPHSESGLFLFLLINGIA